MELRWTPEAIADRESIYEHVEADNPAAALALDELFAACAARLIDHPGLGRTGRVQGTRELVAHRNYILIAPGQGAAQSQRHACVTRRQALFSASREDIMAALPSVS